MGFDAADARQHDMLPVWFDADAAGGESAGKSTAALALEPGKADLWALSLAMCGV
jgi:hypothetical protein